MCIQVEMVSTSAPISLRLLRVDSLLVQLPPPISLPIEQNIDNNPLCKERKEPYDCRNDSAVVGAGKGF